MRRVKREGANRGFSLVELIIAIAILVILTGLLAPQFMRYIEKSREAVCRKNRDEMANIYRMEYVGNVQYLMVDVIKDYKDREPCPSDGEYIDWTMAMGMPWLMCSVHDEEDLKKNPGIVAAENVYNSMYDFAGKNPTDVKKDIARFYGIADWTKVQTDNDTLRRYLYDKTYGKAWPTLDKELLKKNGYKEEDLYVQPCIGVYGNSLGNAKNKDVIVFANTNKDTSKNNWYTSLIYNKEDGRWYGGTNGISVAQQNWESIKKEMKDKGWKPLDK